MPRVKYIIGDDGKLGYEYTCICGKTVRYYYSPDEPTPEKLQPCWDCIDKVNLQEVTK